MNTDILTLPIDQVFPDTDQPRQVFDVKALNALADSIKHRGLIHPIIVTKAKKGYRIWDGERRWRATQRAGLKEIHAIVKEIEPTTAEVWAGQIAANQHSMQLSELEVAQTIKAMSENGYTQNDIAAYLTKEGIKLTSKTVSNAIRLAEAPKWALALLKKGQLEPDAARTLSTLARFDHPRIKEAMSYVKENIEKEAKTYEDPVGESVVRWNFNSWLQDKTIDLTAVASWHEDPVRFDHRKVCSTCEHRIKGGNERWFCLNPDGFKEQQAKAIEAGLEPGGKKPKKQSKSKTKHDLEKQKEIKAEQREQTIARRVRETMHEQLRVQVRLCINLTTAHAINAWMVAGAPGSYMSAPRGVSVKPSNIIAALDEPKGYVIASAEAVVNHMPWNAIHALARRFKGEQLEQAWAPDEEFIKIFRKAELVQMIEEYGIETASAAGSMKLAELREAVLKDAGKIARHKAAVATYECEPEFSTAWGYYDDDETEEDDGKEE